MSFFFDVWTRDGFILASDVRLTTNDGMEFMHKVKPSRPQDKVVCAIAVCGEYPENNIRYFLDAVAVKDTLRGIALRFAEKWTRRYAGMAEYSAVHLVGFEPMLRPESVVPQVWFWCNSGDTVKFLDEEVLKEQLASFELQVPINNHLPQKIKQLTGRQLPASLEEERDQVAAFLESGPHFTWNGDTTFWQSASEAVGSAAKLLFHQSAELDLEKTAELTHISLQFLSKVGNLMGQSTVGLSEDGLADVLVVSPKGCTWNSKTEPSTVPMI